MLMLNVTSQHVYVNVARHSPERISCYSL